jgi:hypothetical protein
MRVTVIGGTGRIGKRVARLSTGLGGVGARGPDADPPARAVAVSHPHGRTAGRRYFDVSQISYADCALAIVDELERPRFSQVFVSLGW